MAQEIYNEGRVVGLSAWELFSKAALSNGVSPDKIPNESEWLSSMIGSGASLILKVPSGTTKGVHDYDLPNGSELSAAGIIIANPFMGTCEWDSNWAKKVTSYSSLLQNTTTSSPADDGSTVPYNSNYSEQECAACVSEFIKITDGLVYTKNATWIPTGDVPQKDIDPNFNESSTVVRLYVSATTTADIYVMLTGFTNKRILQGLSGFAVWGSGHSIGGSTDITANDWKNGGMIGPEIIPWATKIFFTVPSSAYSLVASLTRTIPSDTTYTIPAGGLDIDGITIKENAIDGTVKSNSFIDFNSINLTDYYTIHGTEFSSTPTLSENVSAAYVGATDGYNEVVAWYPGMTAANIAAEASAASPSSDNFYPPALYAAQISTTGTKTLVPLDVAAPGTVKGFKDSTQAFNYKTLLPDNYAIYHDTVNNIFSFVVDGESDTTKWASTAKFAYITGDYPKGELTVGTQKAQVITLTEPDGTTAYNLNGTSGTIEVGPTDNLTWDAMLKGLKGNKAVDVLGTKLHNLGNELKANNTIGITNAVTEAGANKVTLTGTNAVSMTSGVSNSSNVAILGNGQSIKVGTNFIEFGDGLRFYVAGGQGPGTANVPTGSIGVGW